MAMGSSKNAAGLSKKKKEKAAGLPKSKLFIENLDADQADERGDEQSSEQLVQLS
uniref:Uncharacterized protein n=1 Tax=Moniliophthora roreri TaxID=221103 RepID=A0A0W0FDW7_MONRR